MPAKKERRIPIYVRIVPKDIWLRMHVSPSQTVGWIKDAALRKVNAPEVDPSLSYRFYQDALNAASQAKLAPVASHDRVVKHRTYALPRTFVAPPPELGDPKAGVVAALAKGARTRRAPLPPVQSRRGDDSTIATSPSTSELGGGRAGASETSHSQTSEEEWAIRLDPSLMTGDRDAKLEEQLASLRLAQWSATRERSAMDSLNSTPTIASSSQFGTDPGSSPWLGSQCTDESQGSSRAAGLYTQAGATDSFDSLASVGSDEETELVTTADDEASLMQWGTQAEASPLSSPRGPQPSLSEQSPTRPRSRTVTAADVLRSRASGETPPPMPESVSSPTRNSSLPKTLPRRMVAESSQRRAVHTDLLELLKGSADDEPQPRRTATTDKRPVRRTSSSGSASMAGDSATWASPTPSASGEGRFVAGLRWDEISRPGKEVSHPLSHKLTLLSCANGCEMEEWKTVQSYAIRPYELLEMQWAIPTERVYIPPLHPHDLVRPPRSTGKEPHKPWRTATDAGPDVGAACLDPYFEGWVYVLKGGGVAGKEKARAKVGKWKLHWLTIKGWRLDLYRKKPRAGEAMLPVADQAWPLRSVEWVLESDTRIPPNAALPALDTIPPTSLTLCFTSTVAASGAAASEGGMLTLRCLSRFDHEALSTLLMRAWYRAATTWPGVDMWRRKAVFRAVVAGRGGTVAPGRAGRGRGRNAKARTRLRPSGWPKEWEDADMWSSDSEREEVEVPLELEQAVQQRRDTITQLGVEKASGRKKDEDKVIVPNGLYAALLGRNTAASTGAEEAARDSSPYHQGSGHGHASTPSRSNAAAIAYAEPGLMLGNHGVDRRRGPRRGAARGDGSADTAMHRQRSGSLTRSASGGDVSAASRSRSLTVCSPSGASGAGATRGRSNDSSSTGGSRNVSRDASPLPGRRSGASTPRDNAALYPMSPAIAPGFVDVPPPASLLLLKKYKASQASKPS